ncbi:glucose dehydrogenase [Xaviernesmea oryzae]|uniref:Glucose dehydrogenase n=1 Tax=Xaviernesmea oryzae TaxID=464029 RepID=A0A1Q9B2J2_9HYPH|nr:membrane-bound PQQ-dependent dehydrogenase, glucose/quinate/shikimate family [Xaviernesmea oryzae]OLP62218.1 glucose dehydrogenase [Xaviernesmea oryzae]SEL92200.1 quinoprotein glucose dehydrogenase [Xaviernesmea oryzae]
MTATGETARRGVKVLMVRILASILLLIGAMLAIGGTTLAFVGGSPYYVLAGLGLLASGFFLFQLKPEGALIYAAVFVLTVLWAFWEVGLRGWALVPRIVPPALLMALVILCLPVLLPGRIRFKQSLAGALALTGVIVVAGVAISIRNAPAVPPLLAFPMAGLYKMEDPSLRTTGRDWPVYGGSEAARRFSPLDQITRDNVGQLKRAWVAHTGDLPKDPAHNKYGAETTPLKIGETLYLCSAKNILIALDAANGKEKWRYDPKVTDDWIPYTAACRGVAYYEKPHAARSQACSRRIIEGTLDGRLIAVDAGNGEPCADFGDHGAVDIKKGMGEVAPGMVSITSAPTIVRGVVVTGHQVLDGQERSAPSGVIQGFDAETGALRWAWDMTRPDLNGLPPNGQTYTRGTPNMWTTATGDEALGLVYLPMGNSAVDYWSGARSAEEDRYATSLVALNVATGKPVWHFQTVHIDVWDYDLGSQATLVDFPGAGGSSVPALLLPSKQGDIYVLDRRTGQPITAVDERFAPQGGVEPERRARTQPHSLYHTLRKQHLTEDMMWGMSPIDQMVCRMQFRMSHYRGFYTPPTTDKPWIEYPGYNGGSDWGGIAVDPSRGVIIANYNDMPNHNRLVPRAEADAKGWTPRSQARGGDLGASAEGAGDPQAGAPYAIDVNAGWRLDGTGLLCKEPPYGGIRAIDLASGRTIWDRPFGTARKNGPFGIPSMLPVSIGTPNNGGGVITAGGLMFIAAATDDLIRAIEIRTGETVWQDALPAGGQATPITYEIGGRQYVVIMAGGHHFMETPVGDAIIAYALPSQ